MQPELIDHHAEVRARIIRMANQIATFFASKPHDAGVAGVAQHINDFWEPRMRAQLLEIVAEGDAALSAPLGAPALSAPLGAPALSALVRDAAPLVRRPAR
ncbi:MAG: formate dehydrogenase subunit delta [Rhizobiaceae bacterium]|jgi:formate dehydrogenase subunit delta|nr:formate dehydrogenase subunit delta [Rhizobiaceae bacterium]